MSRLIALIPAKDPSLGKSRLAQILSDAERRALNILLARRTLSICVRLFGADEAWLVTDSDEMAGIAREAGARAIVHAAGSGGLNGDLAGAADQARLANADAIAVIPTDLALLTASNLQAALASMPSAPGCVIVPDRRNLGTNLLAMTPPSSHIFAFGEASLERHRELATRLGYAVHVHRCEALGLDIDFPDDYVAWLAKSPQGAATCAGA